MRTPDTLNEQTASIVYNDIIDEWFWEIKSESTSSIIEQMYRLYGPLAALVVNRLTSIQLFDHIDTAYDFVRKFMQFLHGSGVILEQPLKN